MELKQRNLQAVRKYREKLNRGTQGALMGHS